MPKTPTKPGADLRADDAEARRAAAAILGSARTPKKAESSRRALAMRGPDQLGGRPPVPLEGIACTCGQGMALDGHKGTCPRGGAIRRRRAQGKDPLTGHRLSPPTAQGETTGRPA